MKSQKILIAVRTLVDRGSLVKTLLAAEPAETPAQSSRQAFERLSLALTLHDCYRRNAIIKKLINTHCLASGPTAFSRKTQLQFVFWQDA